MRLVLPFLLLNTHSYTGVSAVSAGVSNEVKFPTRTAPIVTN